MKKYVAIILGVLLLVAMGATAYAEIKIKIGGDARARGIFNENYNFNDSVDADQRYYDQRLRIKLTAGLDDKAEIRARFTLSEGTWGQDATVGDVSLDDDDYAYLHVPVGKFNFDVGRQVANWGNKFWLWNNSKDRIKITTKISKTLLGFGHSKAKEFVNPDNEGDVNVYCGFAVRKFASIKGGVRACYIDNDTNDKTGQKFDVFLKGKAGGLGLEAEFAYEGDDLFEGPDGDPSTGGFMQISKALNPLTLSGMVAYANSGYKATEFFTPTVFFGTSQPTAIADFQAADDSSSYAVTLSGTYKVTNALSLTGAFAYASLENLASELTNGAAVDTGNETITEIDAKLKYKISKKITYYVDFGYLMPSDITPQDDAAMALAHKIEIKF